MRSTFGFVETRLTQGKMKGEELPAHGTVIDLGIPERMRSMASQFTGLTT